MTYDNYSGHPKTLDMNAVEVEEAASDPAPAPDRADAKLDAPADVRGLDQTATQEENEKTPRTAGDLIADLCDCRRRLAEATEAKRGHDEGLYAEVEKGFFLGRELESNREA